MQPYPVYTLEKAKKLLSQEKLDLILVDINLSDKDGFQFAKHIVSPLAVPFIFLTAHNLNDKGNYVNEHTLTLNISRVRNKIADEPTGNLDSHTTQEVIGLFQTTSKKFHQTIIMITHNDEIAQNVDRTVHIEDGRIVKSRSLQYVVIWIEDMNYLSIQSLYQKSLLNQVHFVLLQRNRFFF